MEKAFSTVLAFLCWTALASAQASKTPAPSVPPSQSPTGTSSQQGTYELPYRYRAAIEPRIAEDNTRYVAVFGGISVFGDSSNAVASADPLLPPPGLGDFDYDADFSTTRLTGGIKAGLVFPLTDPLSDEEVRFSFAAEAEAFYNNFKTSGNVDAGLPAGASMKTSVDADAAVFMVNGLGRLEYHMIRPYLGFGIGTAIINANSRTTLDVPPASDTFEGSDLDLVFATQGLAGLELKLAEKWAIFAEYRHLIYVDPAFEEAAYTVGYDIIQQGIVTGGLKFYY
jgi:opacity protein-like surface antigen